MLAGGFYLAMAALKAFGEAFHNDQFPEALAIKVDELPFVFPLHMVAGGLALVLVPLALSLRRTRWHRLAGRVAAADVTIAGLTAIPVAYVSPVTPVSAAGFIAQAVTWLALLVAGIWHIRHGHVRAHQACMLMLAAVTSGALFFRVYLAMWAVYGVRGHFHSFYALDAWVAWMLPLAATAAVLVAVQIRPRLRPR